jgi:hypothetical protein
MDPGRVSAPDPGGAQDGGSARRLQPPGWPATWRACNLAGLQPGDRLLLNDQHAYLIRRIGRYPDFVALLAAEDPAAITPDIPAEDLLPALRSIYPPETEALGVMALEIEAEQA